MRRNPAGSPLVVPAWWDPRGRFFVWDPATINVGIVLVDDTALRFATADGDGFVVPLSDLDISWPRSLHAVRGSVVRIGSTKHRLYFARPLPGSPRVRRDQITAIADGLAGASKLGPVTSGLLASAAELGEFIGGLVAIPGEFSDQKIGCRNGDRVRAQMDAAGRRAH